MAASLGCFSNVVCMGGVYIGWGRTDLWGNRSKVRDIDHQVKRTKRNLKNWNRIKNVSNTHLPVMPLRSRLFVKLFPLSTAWILGTAAIPLSSVIRRGNKALVCPGNVTKRRTKSALGLHKFDLLSSLLRFSSLIVRKWNFVQCYSFLSIWHIGAASRRDDKLLPWRHSPGS